MRAVLVCANMCVLLVPDRKSLLDFESLVFGRGFFVYRALPLTGEHQ